MNKRFSSLGLSDIAAWMMAVAVYAALAGAGLASGMRNRAPARGGVASHPPAHT